MEFGDSSLISKIGGLVGQGADQVAILSRDVPMDGRSKFSLMSTLIERADVKRRCVVNGIDCASGPERQGSHWRCRQSRSAFSTVPASNGVLEAAKACNSRFSARYCVRFDVGAEQ